MPDRQRLNGTTRYVTLTKLSPTVPASTYYIIVPLATNSSQFSPLRSVQDCAKERTHRKMSAVNVAAIARLINAVHKYSSTASQSATPRLINEPELWLAQYH